MREWRPGSGWLTEQTPGVSLSGFYYRSAPALAVNDDGTIVVGAAASTAIRRPGQPWVALGPQPYYIGTLQIVGAGEGPITTLMTTPGVDTVSDLTADGTWVVRYQYQPPVLPWRPDQRPSLVPGAVARNRSGDVLVVSSACVDPRPLFALEGDRMGFVYATTLAAGETDFSAPIELWAGDHCANVGNVRAALSDAGEGVVLLPSTTVGCGWAVRVRAEGPSSPRRVGCATEPVATSPRSVRFRLTDFRATRSGRRVTVRFHVNRSARLTLRVERREGAKKPWVPVRHVGLIATVAGRVSGSVGGARSGDRIVLMAGGRSVVSRRI